MLKLYQRGTSPPRYWEAWVAAGVVTIHWGLVGERGESQTHEVGWNQTAEALIAEAAQRLRADGFAEVQKNELHEIVVQFILEDDDLDGLDSAEKHLSFIRRMKDQCNQCLGWTGNGHCGGGDISKTSLNLNCWVVDPKSAVVSLATYWESFGYSDEFLIGQRVGEIMQVVYPEDSSDQAWYW